MHKKIYPVVFICLTLTVCIARRGPDPILSPHAVGMANPASVYCAQQGGKSIPVRTDAGESADCQLPDGRRVEEWKLYRSSHR
ncbi:DUF333 domain-containing protein [Labrys sp. KB_33_2]|uniref:putative hemolysin n=1 Tax=Labrys sp. KB_33_2 TaxID=3237479 RepID=UPI003F8DB3C1